MKKQIPEFVSPVIGALVFVALRRWGTDDVAFGFLVFWFTWGIGKVISVLYVMNTNQVVEFETTMKARMEAMNPEPVPESKKSNPIGFL